MRGVVESGRGSGGRIGDPSVSNPGDVVNAVLSALGGNNRDRLYFGGIGGWFIDNWKLAIIGLLALYVLIRD